MENSGQRFAGARLLLVDDDEISLGMLGGILRNLGISAVLADSGARALDILSLDDRFDGILMDCEMPGATGSETVKVIREMPKYAAMPIVAMTGNVDDKEIDDAIAAGMTGHLAKPIRLKALLPLLDTWLGNTKPSDPD